MLREGLSQPWVRIGSVIEILGAIPASTLSSERVVPHPVHVICIVFTNWCLVQANPVLRPEFCTEFRRESNGHGPAYTL